MTREALFGIFNLSSKFELFREELLSLLLFT
jgi:hypothetical protein